MILQAFHNDPKIQQKFMLQVQGHYDADEIIHGVYWENGKGCAVGCMTHSDQHKDLELLYGIPKWLGYLIDTLFEGMPNKYAKEFVLDFAKTVSKLSFLGFDNWQHIYHQICLYILEKECKNIDHPLVKQAICDIMTLHKTEETDKENWSAAWSAAESAAESASGSAARSAAGSAAGSAAESAAGSASGSAWSAAWSAAESAAGSASGSAARSAAYKSIADNLIELLQAES